MKKYQVRTAPVLAAIVLLAVSLTGCGMNQEKAIQKYMDSFEKSSTMESGRFQLSADMTVSLDGSDSTALSLQAEGSMQDKWKNAAVHLTASLMEQQTEMDIKIEDGALYTQKAGEAEMVPAGADGLGGIPYEQLLTLGQSNLKDIYKSAVETAQDVSFEEGKDGEVSLKFSMGDEVLSNMQEKLKTAILNQILPQMKEQLKQAALEQIQAQPELVATLDEETLNQYVDESVIAMMKIEKELFNSLTFRAIGVEVTVDKNGYLTRQKMDFDTYFDIQAMSDALGAAGEETNLPQNCAISLSVEYNVDQINETQTVDQQVSTPTSGGTEEKTAAA